MNSLCIEPHGSSVECIWYQDVQPFCLLFPCHKDTSREAVTISQIGAQSKQLCLTMRCIDINRTISIHSQRMDSALGSVFMKCISWKDWQISWTSPCMPYLLKNSTCTVQRTFQSLNRRTINSSHLTQFAGSERCLSISDGVNRQRTARTPYM